MGTWGTGLYSDDLAADIRADLRECFGDGLSPSAAVDKLISEYSSSLTDPDETPVFWLAIAETGWRLGRLDERARHQALEIIDSGRDLARWPAGLDRRKREKILGKLRAQLLSPQPDARRVAKVAKSATDWMTGEVIAFCLLSGQWTLMRVIGHHEDNGGRFAVCELLDWTGSSVPTAMAIEPLAIRRGPGPRAVSQFLFQEPRSKKDMRRVIRTGVSSAPAQSPAGYTVFVWPHVDRQFSEVFGLV